MIVYSTDLFKVTNGLLKGIRVIDKRNGVEVKPPADVNGQAATIWVEIKRFKPAQAKSVTHIATNLCFHDLGSLVLGIAHPNQAKTFGLEPTAAAAEYIGQANEHLTGRRF